MGACALKGGTGGLPAGTEAWTAACTPAPGDGAGAALAACPAGAPVAWAGAGLPPAAGAGDTVCVPVWGAWVTVWFTTWLTVCRTVCAAALLAACAVVAEVAGVPFACPEPVCPAFA